MFGLIAGTACQSLIGGPTYGNYKDGFAHGLLPVGRSGTGGASETHFGYGDKNAVFGRDYTSVAKHDPWSAPYRNKDQKLCALNMYHCFDLQENGVPRYAKTLLMG